MSPSPKLEPFLRANSKKKLFYRGRVPSFDGDEHPITIDPRRAGLVLAGEESGFDDARHQPIGFLGGLPLIVEVAGKSRRVQLLAEGSLLTLATSFEAFVRGCQVSQSPGKVASPADKQPTTWHPKEPAEWPEGDVLVVTDPGDVGPHSLRFDASGAYYDIYMSFLQRGRAVGASWRSRTLKYWKGSGVWLDVSRFGKAMLAVTPRVKERIEGLQPKGLEFLPFRGDVKKRVGDLFVMNPTLQVACYDPVASRLPPLRRVQGLRAAIQDDPEKLMFAPAKLPARACFFRSKEYPNLVLASGAMAEALRGDAFSGLNLIRPESWHRRG